VTRRTRTGSLPPAQVVSSLSSLSRPPNGTTRSAGSSRRARSSSNGTAPALPARRDLAPSRPRRRNTGPSEPQPALEHQGRGRIRGEFSRSIVLRAEVTRHAGPAGDQIVEDFRQLRGKDLVRLGTQVGGAEPGHLVQRRAFDVGPSRPV